MRESTEGWAGGGRGGAEGSGYGRFESKLTENYTNSYLLTDRMCPRPLASINNKQHASSGDYKMPKTVAQSPFQPATGAKARTICSRNWSMLVMSTMFGCMSFSHHLSRFVGSSSVSVSSVAARTDSLRIARELSGPIRARDAWGGGRPTGAHVGTSACTVWVFRNAGGSHAVALFFSVTWSTDCFGGFIWLDVDTQLCIGPHASRDTTRRTLAHGNEM